jgi:molybdopterin-guanine dinucleotide biosynthesis protein A
MRSAVILAGGRSTRMNGDKGLKELGGEILVNRIIRRVNERVDEVLIVVGSEEQKEAYFGIVDEDVTLLVDLYSDGSPLVGAITGLKHAKGEYAFMAACDMPFISDDVVEFLFKEAEGYDGAVFQWPNEWIEPLLAVYRVKPSLEKALELYGAGDLRVRRILQNLPDVKMIPMDDLKAMDADLHSLFDADTEEALLEAERILEKKGIKG